MINFVLGFLFCAVIAWYSDREQRKRYDSLYANFLSLVNEMSVRTGGRKVFKDKKPVSTNETNEPSQQRGEFRLVTPSMAEVEAIERDETESESNLSESDMEHLRRTGLIQ